MVLLGTVFFVVNDWNKGFAALEQGFILCENNKNFYSGDTKAITEIVFRSKLDKNIWKARIKALVELYDKYKVVSELVRGIIENIPNLISEMVSNKAARTWLEVWQEVAGDKSELEISYAF